MPFTFSHPAIILPLYRYAKKWVSLTGLIIGSIVPDFEYFLRMKSKSYYSHTLFGLFWFDLPLSLFLCFLFHNVIRNPLFSHLPNSLNSRLSNFKRFSWNSYFKKNWLTIVLCLLVGAFSHLVWDHFTHERGYVLKLNNFLDKDVTDISLPVPKYSTFQKLSSVLGLSFVIYALFQMPVTDKIKRPFYYRYWINTGIIVLTIMGIRFISGLKFYNSYEVLVNLISGIIIALTVTSLYLRNQYY